jgi:hypothetical protein
MSVWDKLVQSDPNTLVDPSTRIDIEGAAVRIAALTKLIKFIANNQNVYPDLKRDPFATALVMDLIKESLEDSQGVASVNVQDKGPNDSVSLSEISAPCSEASGLKEALLKLEDPEFRESVLGVWAWIQRGHTFLTYLKGDSNLEAVNSQRVDGQGKLSPSLRQGLKAADDIIASYMSGFVRGSSQRYY